MTDTPERAAEDVLSRSVRLTLGGREFVLPVLTIAGNRRWKAELDARLTSSLSRLRDEKTPALYDVLSGQVDQMLELLLAYDTTHVLPSREELEEMTYEEELVAAVREVWRAANPLVVTATLAAMTQALMNGSLQPTSSRRQSGAGSPARSSTN